MTKERRRSGVRVLLSAAGVATAVALAGCSIPTSAPTGSKAPSASTSAGTSDAGAGTPSADPSVLPDAGAYNKPSTGGVRYAPTGSGKLDGKVITIDPGHSGKYDTALLYRKTINYFGTGYRPCQNAGSTALDKTTLEAELVFDIGARVVPLLTSQGATVWLTRPDNNGYGPCNDERAQIANRAKADLLISIHGDGSTNTKNRGYFVEHSLTMMGGAEVAARSTDAAHTLIAALKGRTAIPVSNYVGSALDGTIVNSKTLGVLNTMQTGPAVLLEVGNIISPDDWAVLSTQDGRQGLAAGIADGAAQIVLGAAAPAPASPTPKK